MTTPNQPAPPDGAFEIGGGDYNYGQAYTESAVRGLFAIPAPTPLNALNLLREQLGRLPLEALQMFKDLIPDPIEWMFETVGGAVDAIMDALTNNPVFLAITAFQDFLAQLWANPGQVISEIGQNMVEGLVDLAGAVQQGAQDFVDFLEELWNNPGAVIEKIGQGMVDGLDDALGFLNSAWNQMGDIVQGLFVTPINEAVSQFQDWWGRITDRVQEGFDDAADAAGDLWAGLLRTFGLGPKSSSEVSNAAAELSEQAEKSRDLGEWNNAILGVRNNKSIMQGVDETEESTFLMSDLFNGSAAPPLMNVTSAAVPVAFWRATEWATKGFISWFGEGYTNVTGLYIDLYKLNYATSVMELFHSSDNLVGLADTTWKYIVYYIDEAHRFEVFPGDVIGVGMRVTGAGTHKVAAKSAPWLPAHPTAVPAKPSASKTGTGNVAFGSITYSTDLPWFGIGIVAGDTPPLFFTPRSTVFTTTGSHTYTIPSWANFVDVTMVGGGGGGHRGNEVGQGGEGGDAGSWASETLQRGVDFPVGASTLTFTVGAGGAPNSGGVPGGLGGSSVRAAIASGKAVFTAAGGPGGNAIGGSGVNGDSPGNHTYGGTTYVGGGTSLLRAVAAGSPGKSPGGGGAGGSGGFVSSYSGGVGAPGSVWSVARQS